MAGRPRDESIAERLLAIVAARGGSAEVAVRIPARHLMFLLQIKTRHRLKTHRDRAVELGLHWLGGDAYAFGPDADVDDEPHAYTAPTTGGFRKCGLYRKRS